MVVLDGPVQASGYDWYLVQPTIMSDTEQPYPFGWVAAAGKDGEPWIEPMTPRMSAVAGRLSRTWRMNQCLASSRSPASVGRRSRSRRVAECRRRYLPRRALGSRSRVARRLRGDAPISRTGQGARPTAGGGGAVVATLDLSSHARHAGTAGRMADGRSDRDVRPSGCRDLPQPPELRGARLGRSRPGHDVLLCRLSSSSRRSARSGDRNRDHEQRTPRPKTRRSMLGRLRRSEAAQIGLVNDGFVVDEPEYEPVAALVAAE